MLISYLVENVAEEPNHLWKNSKSYSLSMVACQQNAPAKSPKFSCSGPEQDSHSTWKIWKTVGFSKNLEKKFAVWYAMLWSVVNM